MNVDSSLIQYAEDNMTIMTCLRDRVAVWIFGYIYLVESATRKQISVILKVSENESTDRSIDKLIEAGYIFENEDGMMSPTGTAKALADILGLSGQMVPGSIKREVSLDLFLIDNVNIANAAKSSKQAIISELVEHPRLHSVPGNRYGFVECRCLGDGVIFGYLTQEYTAQFIDYDEHDERLERHDEWPTKFDNTLFVWPIDSQVYVLQDKRFFGAPTLNMNQTKSRVQMLLSMLCDYHGFEHSGDLVIKPYERELLKSDMLDLLFNSDQVVTETGIELGNVTAHLDEKLPVFNPRDDWNEALTEIINDFEIPNIAKVAFSATILGTLAKSKLVKALALAGRPRVVKLGRGKYSKTYKRKIPTHVGKATVSDPATPDDIASILNFLQERLGLVFGDISFKPGTSSSQMKFEI